MSLAGGQQTRWSRYRAPSRGQRIQSRYMCVKAGREVTDNAGASHHTLTSTPSASHTSCRVYCTPSPVKITFLFMLIDNVLFFIDLHTVRAGILYWKKKQNKTSQSPDVSWLGDMWKWLFALARFFFEKRLEEKAKLSELFSVFGCSVYFCLS